MNRSIKYLNKDFNSIKQDIIEYSKVYFPNTFNDFTETSTGMLFIDMSSYIGDILSFYIDTQIQECFIQYSKQTKNIYNWAHILSYKPRVTSPSKVSIDFYQKVPAKNFNGEIVPDYDYTLRIPINTTITTDDGSNIPFLLTEEVDFSFSSSYDPTEITIYETLNNEPVSFILKKSQRAISAQIKNIEYTFSSPKKFDNRVLVDNNIIKILDVIDDEGNIWYEVPHLSQSNIFKLIKNKVLDEEVPYILKLKNCPYRFTTRFINEDSLRIEWGAGGIFDESEEITPNPDNVGIGLPFERDKLTTAFSPLNFMYTNSYGLTPSNTTLYIKYLTGGGINSNVNSNTITNIDDENIVFNNSNLPNTPLIDEIFNSLRCNNELSADGGFEGDTLEDIKLNSLGNYQSQLRVVTSRDYITRAISMPSKLGTISKAFVQNTRGISLNPGEIPSNLDLYILSYDNNKYLRTASNLLKENLKTYLYEYIMLNDRIKIKDAYIINIGVDFEIITFPEYNNNEVILNCIENILDFFNIDKWEINQPIILKDLYILLDKVEGVQTVSNIKIYNKSGQMNGYSQFKYDIVGATKCNIIYPSLDPMIFELKYQNDVKGRVVPLC